MTEIPKHLQQLIGGPFINWIRQESTGESGIARAVDAIWKQKRFGITVEDYINHRPNYKVLIKDFIYSSGSWIPVVYLCGTNYVIIITWNFHYYAVEIKGRDNQWTTFDFKGLCLKDDSDTSSLLSMNGVVPSFSEACYLNKGVPPHKTWFCSVSSVEQVYTLVYLLLRQVADTSNL